MSGLKARTMAYNGTIFNHLLQPANGLGHERSGLTSLARVTGKVRLDCPECGIAFERYACWVKRKKVCYCSKACADEGKRRPVEVQCVVCATTFISTPGETSRGRVATCSNACLRANRSELTRRGVLLPKGHRAGREQGNGKLTTLQANEIATSTESTWVLVARYDVSATTVRDIRRAHRRANSNTPTATHACAPPQTEPPAA